MSSAVSLANPPDEKTPKKKQSMAMAMAWLKCAMNPESDETVIV